MSVGLCDVVVKYRGMEIADVEQSQTNQQQEDLNRENDKRAVLDPLCQSDIAPVGDVIILLFSWQRPYFWNSSSRAGSRKSLSNLVATSSPSSCQWYKGGLLLKFHFKIISPQIKIKILLRNLFQN